ncbi:hypothetical protein DICVIV_13707, partial [Dictyocaulus viviparus]
MKLYLAEDVAKKKHTNCLTTRAIADAVNSWWKTALNDGTLVNLTPSEENRKMIPFLQMANGKTNKLGCAYHICDADYENYDETGDDSKGYLLFVCKYGDPHIKIGTPIYTEGEPCDSCKDRCTFNNALCDTKSSSRRLRQRSKVRPPCHGANGGPFRRLMMLWRNALTLSNA